uniref:Uncharacterized protein n=1 Tax=Anopheles christyi TaxID=43041 RepID=A0A182K792_9DIPT
MATFDAVNASKRNPVDPEQHHQHQQQQQQQQQQVATGEVRSGGMEPMGSGVESGRVPQGEENAKKCNAKVSGALGRRKGSGSGLEVGRNAKPSRGVAHAPSAHSLINYLFYLMCITALGATVYSNLRQSYVEDKLSSLVSIEERLSLLEARVSDVYRRITLRRMDVSPVANDVEEESMSEVVRKISHQIAELPRMRRDLSALKVSRKDRQAAIQQIGNECMCPPDNTG